MSTEALSIDVLRRAHASVLLPRSAGGRRDRYLGAV